MILQPAIIPSHTRLGAFHILPSDTRNTFVLPASAVNIPLSVSGQCAKTHASLLRLTLGPKPTWFRK